MKKRLLAMALAVIIMTTSVSYTMAAEVDASLSGRAATAYTLQDSTACDTWKDYYASYNCYAYAIGRTDDFHWPGRFSTAPNRSDFNTSDTVYTWACDVRADLMSSTFAKQCVAITTTMPTSLTSTQSCICIRKGGNDFHFMKLKDGEWYHKPGESVPLKYNYTPSTSRNWTNEALLEGGARAPTREYTGQIYYIIYSQNHGSTTSTYSGRNYHAGSRHFFEYEHRCDSCGVVVSTSLTNKACSGPPCSILQGGTPNPEVA